MFAFFLVVATPFRRKLLGTSQVRIGFAFHQMLEACLPMTFPMYTACRVLAI
jgi:hypothetical protein